MEKLMADVWKRSMGPLKSWLLHSPSPWANGSYIYIALAALSFLYLFIWTHKQLSYHNTHWLGIPRHLMLILKVSCKFKHVQLLEAPHAFWFPSFMHVGLWVGFFLAYQWLCETPRLHTAVNSKALLMLSDFYWKSYFCLLLYDAIKKS